MVTCVFETYWNLLNKASCQLSAKRETAFSSGNICIVDHVIEIIQKRVEQWRKVQSDEKIPWEVNEDYVEHSEVAKNKVETILKDLLWNLKHFADKLKMEDIGNVELFVNLIVILYARWRFKIVYLQAKLASLAIRKKSNFC